jgi:hypothetical protein
MRDQVNFKWDQSQDFASYIVELEQIKRRLGRWGSSSTKTRWLQLQSKR